MYGRRFAWMPGLITVAMFLVGIPTYGAPQVIFLVRHAERTSATAPDSPLSLMGLRRAGVLAEMLKESGISAIYATEYIRTQQTVKPLAEKLGIPVTIVAAADTERLLQILQVSPAPVVLVAGHGNTLPGLIESLGGGEVSPISPDDYDRFFILVFTSSQQPRLLVLHYAAVPGVNAPVADHGLKVRLSDKRLIMGPWLFRLLRPDQMVLPHPVER